jgi:lysophospholipid acyltransferase (LPLAT)-like uncharacterized protein
MPFLRNHVLPPLIAVFYWLWSRTWRLRILEDSAFIDEKSKNPVAFAHWHGDEMVVLCLGPQYRCAAMTSTSSDGELMTRVLRLFGFGISRGSSTRGGARALVGMVRLVKGGYNATVAVDGPKGPRHKVKPGIWHLAKHAGIKIIPTGVAKQRAFVFEKSWNKTYLPLPFTKVVVRFGSPLSIPEEIDDNNIADLEAELERRLHLERGLAQAHLLGGEKCVSPV